MILLAFDRRMVMRAVRPSNAIDLRKLRNKLAEPLWRRASFRSGIMLHGSLALATLGA
ncbi:hypothetical protein GCM10017620_06600 [Brevundimonas intermedia]|uniref:Uncharacterized protein n=1 Tax=Brevundimonas intermedia TaxID=74315 RepID=A0ABQ5T529_9CAUL|nr:hypothetical protein GCM10017620_06600 [Brevundimonas intermedia]